jgi:hypothetical protein
MWNGPGAPPPPEGAIGLRNFEIVVPGGSDRELMRDPSGNGVLLRAR